MDFSQALVHLKAGETVYRTGLHGVCELKIHKVGLFGGLIVDTTKYAGKLFPEVHNFTQAEILAEDWRVV